MTSPINATDDRSDTTRESMDAAGKAIDWKRLVAKYQIQDVRRSVWQLINTLVPYALLWGLMPFSLRLSYWMTLVLVILAGGFVVRIFIIHHDCGHGSFFKSRTANGICGFITGILTFTPYYLWRWEHAVHHASSGNLDRRGLGDVTTWTVQEYLAASPWKRFVYRVKRHPIVLFLIAPPILFLIRQRFSTRGASRREQLSVWWTNLAILGMILIMGSMIGFKEYLILQVAVMMVASSAGVWMFYVQHQFENVYWERANKWDHVRAALEGSSFYKLPRVLQWFTGNIGYHHIHHLSSRIPNYYLEKCHRAHAIFQEIKPITLLSSLKTLRLRLWDEHRRCMVGFNQIST